MVARLDHVISQFCHTTLGASIGGRKDAHSFRQIVAVSSFGTPISMPDDVAAA